MRNDELLERTLASEERAEQAQVEITRLRTLVHKLIGDGDEALGISAAAMMGRATAAEELVREILSAIDSNHSAHELALPGSWEPRARAQMAAARTASSSETAKHLADYLSAHDMSLAVRSLAKLTEAQAVSKSQADTAMAAIHSLGELLGKSEVPITEAQLRSLPTEETSELIQVFDSSSHQTLYVEPISGLPKYYTNGLLIDGL